MELTCEAANHPRPQFRRAAWRDLCGEWGFAHDDADKGLRDRWFEREEVFSRRILVPYPPESRLSGINDTGFHPVVWYRRSITLSEEERARRLVLHFGAVDYKANVWVNGRLVAEHAGGHTPFSADITPYLSSGGGQTITVRAEDDPRELRQPGGGARSARRLRPTPKRWSCGGRRTSVMATPGRGSSHTGCQVPVVRGDPK